MLYAAAGDPIIEYSPSKCSTRFLSSDKPDEAVLQHFTQLTTNETERVKKVYQVQENVRYGGVDDNQVLDIFSKPNAEQQGAPIFAFIHGGYWQYMSKDGSGSFVAPLVERGFRVINVEYNLCPVTSLQQLTEDIKNFYKWLSNYAQETKSQEIYICGHSAGAHLLSYVISEELITLPCMEHLKGLFFIGGVYDLRELWNMPDVNEKDNLCLDEKKAVELSPVLTQYKKEILDFFKQNKTKFHVLVAEHDSTTFKGQTEAFAKHLQTLGLEVLHKVFLKYDHFDIIEEASDEQSDIGSYILKYTSS